MRILPIHLEPESRFECHRCGACCRQTPGIQLEPSDLKHLREIDWASDEVRFADGVTETAPSGGFQRLKTRGGACVFLDDDGLCRVHKRLGEAKKPLRCRAFPYRFATIPTGIAVSVSFECRSLHRSVDQGPLVTDTDALAGIALAHPRLMILGKAFIMRNGEPPRIPFEEVRSLFAEVVESAIGAESAEEFPIAVLRAVRRRLNGPVPRVPWTFDGPPEVPFYQCLNLLGEVLSPHAKSLGLEQIASAMAAMRKFMIWPNAASGLDARARSLLPVVFRSLVFEFRTLQLPQLVAGLGAAVYLTLVAAVGASRIGDLTRHGKGTAEDVNQLAAECSVFFRAPSAIALMGSNLLAFERVIFDAPRPPQKPQTGFVPGIA